MNKEQWNKIRDNEVFDTEVLYEFFKEKGGSAELSISEFANIFGQMDHQIVATNNGLKRVTHQGAMEKVREYYEEKFN